MKPSALLLAPWMNRATLSVLALLLIGASFAPVGKPADQGVSPGPQAGPYVTVYRDSATAFQVRRDRIKTLDGGIFQVRLRWLWAKPRPWKGQDEVALVMDALLDCRNQRLRELDRMHKNRKGDLYDIEEPGTEPDWKEFEKTPGAAAALQRLCDFIPELLSSAEKRRDG